MESCQKCLLVKNLRMKQKKFHADLIKKRRDGGVLKLDAYAAAKQKIILSWPNECIVF